MLKTVVLFLFVENKTHFYFMYYIRQWIFVRNTEERRWGMGLGEAEMTHLKQAVKIQQLFTHLTSSYHGILSRILTHT